jgi:hypothetical protein
MTRPSTPDLRVRSILAGEASAAPAELEAAVETPGRLTAGVSGVTLGAVLAAMAIRKRVR